MGNFTLPAAKKAQNQRDFCPAAAIIRALSERWQSGRMYLTRNQAMSQGIRGFESHPLRQSTSKQAPSGAFLFYTHHCTHQYEMCLMPALQA
jgi:hypothetical protein